jgi:hypothetical protein
MIGYPLLQLEAGTPDGSVAQPQYYSIFDLDLPVGFHARMDTCNDTALRILVPASTVSISSKIDRNASFLSHSHTLRPCLRYPAQHYCLRHTSIQSCRDPRDSLAMGANRLSD